MFSFFTNRQKKVGAQVAFTPSVAELSDAMTNGAKTLEMERYLAERHARQQAERQVAEAARQQQLVTRQRALVAEQQPGELWLHTVAGPKRALARQCYHQGSPNENKLVLGPAGSGRSLMLARLARAAHEGGNFVVMLNNFGTNHNNPGPLWMLTHSLDGNFVELTSPASACFNPFWLPGAKGEAWRLPTLEEMSALSTVLANVLRLTRYDVPVREEKLEEWLYHALTSYFTSQELEASNEPDFTSFAAVVATRPRGVELGGLEPEFLDWFAQVSQPFVAGGALGHLLNAKPYQLRHLLYSSHNLLHIELTLDERAATEADTPGFSQRAWPHQAAQAQTRVLMLLLHTFDSFLGQNKRRLTIVADELHYDTLGTRMAAYLDKYLIQGEHYNRELIVGWHEYPTTVFANEHPAAQVILSHSGTQLLLANMLLNSGDVSSYAPLDLSEEEQLDLVGISRDVLDVLVRYGDEYHRIFSAALAEVDLTDFKRKRQPQ